MMIPLPDDFGRLAQDDPAYDPEPDDPYVASYVGVYQYVLGACVIEGADGRWRCEHGRGPHTTDTVAALDCLKNCDIEEEEV